MFRLSPGKKYEKYWLRNVNNVGCELYEINGTNRSKNGDMNSDGKIDRIW